MKTELRDMERMQKREGVDMTYLKNVVLKLLETGIYFKLSEMVSSQGVDMRHRKNAVSSHLDNNLAVHFLLTR